MTGTSKDVSYSHTILFSLLMGVIGVLLLIISHIVDKGLLSDLLRDLGMVLCPISLVALIYEIDLRKQFDQKLSLMSQNLGFVQIVYIEHRHQKMDELIDSARESLIIVGSSPLYEFCPRSEDLIKKFKKLKSVKIAYLARNSPYLGTRQAQSCANAEMSLELDRHEILIKQLKDGLDKDRVEFICFNLPPAEFFFICDDRMLLASWYPYGMTGERCPLIFVENLQKNTESPRMLQHYTTSLKFLRDSTRNNKGQ